MALRKTLTFAGFALGLTLACNAVGFAQQPQTPGDQDSQQERGRGGRRRGGPRGGGFGMMRALRDLNLSEAQRQQARAIVDRYAASTKAQRDQLMQLREQYRDGDTPADVKERAKALREQLHQSEKAMRTELLSILTPEQRAALEQKEQERKSRRDEWRKRKENNQPETR
jgi:Spy/CpxP family protein refolding chaperone